MIKVQGQRVSPEEIEQCLHQIDGVREAAAIGIPGDGIGTRIKVIIAPKDGRMEHVCLRKISSDIAGTILRVIWCRALWSFARIFPGPHQTRSTGRNYVRWNKV